MSKRIVDLGEKNLEDLGLSPEVVDILTDIRATVDEQYRERFVEMAQAINRQAAALERIQTTLTILVESLAPQLKESVPVAFRMARADEEPDLASALVMADPIGAGFTLTQADVARALKLTDVDVSYLIRDFGVRDDPDLAVQVRRGKGRPLYNYHRRVVDRLRELVQAPPEKKLKKTTQQAMARALKAWGLG